MCLDREAVEQIYHSGKDATIAKIMALDAQVDELTAKIAKLSKNSSNSSKPPSSDIVKPNRARGRRDKKAKRKKGGQMGHPKHERKLFSEDEIDISLEYRLDACPQCKTSDFILLSDEKPRILQQIEIKDVPIEVTEHKAYAYWCPTCKKIQYKSFPPEVIKEGLFKHRLTSVVSYLKYKCNVSYAGIRTFLVDVFGPKGDVSEGFLAKLIQKGTYALDPVYQELFDRLAYEDIVNVDETGHKENGNKLWTWVFRTSLYSLFKIDTSRGSDVLIDVLGEEFNGVLGCDYFSAYRKYMRVFNVVLQFCLAHLIRDLKYLCGLKDPETMRYGKKLLKLFRELFHLIHDREKLGEKKLTAMLEKQKMKIIRFAKYKAPSSKEAQNMADRFRKHGKAYFQFITTPGIEPTNNIAEQAIRFIVIYRRVSQGTRSINGRRACERFWTVISTCQLQAKSAFEFISEALHAYFNNVQPPSLIPNSS